MFSARMTKNVEEKVLLIVDNEPVICRFLKRILEKEFDYIHTACSGARGQMILENFPVSHIICDYDLGEPQNGITLATRWKRQFPMIIRAFIFTGGDVSQLQKNSEIDRIISKGESIKQIICLITAPHLDLHPSKNARHTRHSRIERSGNDACICRE